MSSVALGQEDEMPGQLDIQELESAQQLDPSHEIEPELIAALEERDPKTFALLVGTSSFRHLDELSRPDAKTLCFASALSLYKSIPTGDVIALCEPEDAIRAQIIASATQIRDRAQAGDTILFVFIGLGVGSDFDEPTFLTHDMTPLSDQLQATSIGVDEMVSSLRKDNVKLIMVLDASIDATLTLSSGGTLVTTGPIASNISGKHLTISYSASPREWQLDENLFGRTLADGLAGASDLDQDSQISAAELKSFMVMQIDAHTSKSLGLRGEWNDSTEPFLTLPTPEPIVEVIEPRSWRPSAPPAMRKIVIIGGSSMLATGAVTYALAWRSQNQLEDLHYNNQSEYNSMVSQRNALLWTSRGTGALGAIALGGGLILHPQGATVSVTARW